MIYLSKNENVNEIIVEYEELELGKPYVFTLTSGAFLLGILSSKREDLSNGSVTREYEILFDNATHVYLHECQIVNIREIPADDTEECFKELENNYDVRCFDNEGKLLPASRILYNVLVEKKIWNKMKKKERKGLIQHLCFNDKDILEIIEVFLIQEEENEKLCQDKSKVLKATTELLDNYGKIMNTSSYIDGAYNLIFNELGLKKFIKQIC